MVVLSTSANYNLYPNPKVDSKQNIEITDLILIEKDKALFIEMKAKSIPDKTVSDTDPQKCIDKVKEKYFETNQLARAINMLADSTWKPEDKNMDIKGVLTIYPVMLTYDSLVNLLAQDSFFADEFKNSLEPEDELSSGSVKNGRFVVRPLTILSIDVLEDLEVSPIDIFSLLDNYSIAEPNRDLPLNNFASQHIVKNLLLETV